MKRHSKSVKRKPRKREKKLIKKMVITKDLLIQVIYSLNSMAKLLHINSKERTEVVDSLERKFYEGKRCLLETYFIPTEIHLDNGGELLYYSVDLFIGFHIPHIPGYDRNLKKVVINREKTPNLRACKILDMDFCLWVVKLVGRLMLI